MPPRPRSFTTLYREPISVPGPRAATPDSDSEKLGAFRTEAEDGFDGRAVSSASGTGASAGFFDGVGATVPSWIDGSDGSRPHAGQYAAPGATGVPQ